MAFPDGYTAWGGTAADFTTTTYDLKEGVTLIRALANQVTIWDGPTPTATQVTDLYDHNGAPVHELVSETSGMLRTFWAPSANTELWAVVQGAPPVQLVPHGGGSVAWTDVKDKPVAFPPAAHAHTLPDLPDLADYVTGRIAGKANQAALDTLSTAVNTVNGVLDGRLSEASLDAKIAASEGTPSSGAPSYASAATKQYSPATCHYNVKPSNTRRWRAGIARAGRTDYAAGPQAHNALWLGDSIVNGCTGILEGGTRRFDRLNTVSDFYRRAVSAKTGIAEGGDGLIKANDASYRDPRWTAVSGTLTASGGSVQIAAGATMTLTANKPGAQIVMHYYDNWAGATGLQVQVNGTTVSTVNGDLTNSQWQNRVITTPIVAGDLIKITNTFTGSIVFLGLEIVPAGGGIRSHNAGQSGTKTPDWITFTSGFDNMRALADPNALPFVPDVVFAGWGLFDAQDGVTPAAVRANLATIRGRWPNSDFVILADPTPGALTDAQWFPYLTAMYGAADDLDVPLLDVHQLFGVYVGMQALGLTGDFTPTAHYLPAGYKTMAEAAVRMVL